jgi:hypothetical protein
MGLRIGDAGDFYRLRVIRLDQADVPELDWRDDVLYRRPLADSGREYDVYQVEAIDVDDEECACVLRHFETADGARDWLVTVQEDLGMMTKSEFERTYFVEGSPEEEDPEPA